MVNWKFRVAVERARCFFHDADVAAGNLVHCVYASIQFREERVVPIVTHSFFFIRHNRNSESMNTISQNIYVSFIAQLLLLC